MNCIPNLLTPRERSLTAWKSFELWQVIGDVEPRSFGCNEDVCCWAHTRIAVYRAESYAH